MKLLAAVLLAGLLQSGCLWRRHPAESQVQALPLLSAQRSRVQWYQEQAVFLEVNRFRQEAGLPPLHFEFRLQQTARDHSLSMARYGYFGHYDLDGDTVRERLLRRSVTGWRKAAENIAKETDSTQAAREVCRSWMNSSGHRRNILAREYSETGVGAVLDSEGNIVFTQVFLER